MEARPLVVVGAGVAGTAAAIEAAKVGVQVTLIDENPVPAAMAGLNVPLFFGQRFEDALSDRALMMERVVAANEGLSKAEDAGVDIRLGTCVWGAFRNSENSRVLDGPQIGLADHERSWMMKYDRLIVAAGSRDLSFGFAGCNLVGAMGANGAYSLMSRYDALAAKRMVVLGSGNLGLNTAKMALDNGIEVAAIVDVAPSVRGNDALVKTIHAQGVELFSSHTVKEAVGSNGDIESVMLVEIDDDCKPVAGTEKVITADTICLAIGLVPNVEILSLLNCDLNFKSELGGYVPSRDDWMRTSVDNVFVAGDAAGIHDAMFLDRNIARNQGRIAGIAAAESPGAITSGFPPSTGKMSEGQRGTSAFSNASSSPTEVHTLWKRWLRSLANVGGQDIVVCQCEEVTRSEIIGLEPPRYLEWGSDQMSRRSLQTQLKDNPVNPNQVKRLTRAGTGTCQGRNCREQVALLLAEESNTDIADVPLSTYRAPLRPLPLNVLWPDDESEDVRNEWPKWFSPNNKVLG
ncbi:MAG: NAD(P)/FAD-dependent oxidoreductase [Chloroflexi bacterium]|nr:NAD(P)/FAD-dependent oxidoreductase [Chloroflexota bacterium]